MARISKFRTGLTLLGTPIRFSVFLDPTEFTEPYVSEGREELIEIFQSSLAGLARPGVFGETEATGHRTCGSSGFQYRFYHMQAIREVHPYYLREDRIQR